MSETMVDFHKRLIARMSEMRMSQADLCRSTGLATSMVSHYCTGQRVPSVQVAGKIAKALDTSIDALFSEEQKSGDPDLLMTFRSLNAEGQAKVLAYIEDLQLTRKYRSSKK